MGLKAKFNLVMLLAFTAGLALAGALSWRLVEDTAREQVLAEAALVLASADAVGSYTDREIAPLLAAQMKDQFIPQANPFFAEKTNFRQIADRFPDYSFQEPSLNPTNPADRANAWQADIIDAFRRDPKLEQLVTTRPAVTGSVLSLSRPIRVSDQGCLSCHATPEAAPAALVQLYGREGGFGWQMGETVGAAIVSVPTRVAEARAWSSFVTLMGGLAGVFAVMLVALNLMLHFVIVRPVRRMSALASEVSLGNMDAPEYQARGRDEIASLGESFNRMRRSLANAMRMLDG